MKLFSKIKKEWLKRCILMLSERVSHLEHQIDRLNERVIKLEKRLQE